MWLDSDECGILTFALRLQCIEYKLTLSSDVNMFCINIKRRLTNGVSIDDYWATNNTVYM